MIKLWSLHKEIYPIALLCLLAKVIDFLERQAGITKGERGRIDDYSAQRWTNGPKCVAMLTSGNLSTIWENKEKYSILRVKSRARNIGFKEIIPSLLDTL